MLDLLPAATNLAAEDVSCTRYAATVAGQRWSGIHAGHRLWASVMQAISGGAIVAPYVERVETAQEKLARTDAELIKVSARAIEDVLAERASSGKYVAQAVRDKIAERVALRAQI